MASGFDQHTLQSKGASCPKILLKFSRAASMYSRCAGVFTFEASIAPLHVLPSRAYAGQSHSAMPRRSGSRGSALAARCAVDPWTCGDRG